MSGTRPDGDPDGTRYRSSYFETFDGVWRQGDWITVDAAVSGDAVDRPDLLSWFGAITDT